MDTLFLIGLLAFCVFLCIYPGWLRNSTGLSPLAYKPIVGGALACFFFFSWNWSEGWWSVICLILSIMIPLGILWRNTKASGGILHGILMTVWQLSAGIIALFVVIGIMDAIKGGKKKKRKE
jgi:hypothetical protein